MAGVEVRELRRLGDERGSFAETYRREWLPAGAGEMVQSNLSRSKAGVLRGMHYHRQQADYWVVVEGRVFVALFDLRSGAWITAGRLVGTFAGLWVLVALSATHHVLDPAPAYGPGCLRVQVRDRVPPEPDDPCRTFGDEARRAFDNTDDYLAQLAGA